MGKTNIASSGFSPVQAGRIVDANDDTQDDTTPPKERRRTSATATNVRSGNARVGMQADVIVGDIEVHL